MSRFASRAAALALALVVGCGGKSEPTAPDTGARAAAEAFFGALVANDPPGAYAQLDPDSKRRVSAERFAALAGAYLKNVGFPVEKVHVRASEEQGDGATVHVTLQGHSAGHSRRYSDGATLRRAGGRWGVVLPANFGQKAH
ncbi:MAG: hypothetical protein J0I06_00500 [Planctomycetes bacterium]|nr:hypothetical protein [Planctomycetota bacterium]